ncbi:hypothetical protein [Caballeronia sp. J97]|uniref:hypothetical protein n=1 Tax=Caballeronia sp. J97 TaxID=2805429 RepID=UPI002AAFFAE1|nr:hypothetical protein [Caballeronia sp. J97]
MQSPRYFSQTIRARLVSATSLAAVLAMSVGCAAQAQPEAAPALAPAPVAGDAAPPPPPSPPMGAVPPAPPPPGGVAADGEATTAEVTVARFLTNPDGDVDGFLTSDGRLVRFPPHMSTQLTSTVRAGDDVLVSGWRDAGGALTAQRITDKRSAQQVVDQPPLPGARPLPRELRGAGLSRLSAQGRVAHVTTAPRGEPDGVILSDGTVIKLTPPVAQQFPALMRTGATVSALGYGTRNQYGTAFQATSFGSPGKLTQIYERFPPAP